VTSLRVESEESWLSQNSRGGLPKDTAPVRRPRGVPVFFGASPATMLNNTSHHNKSYLLTSFADNGAHLP